MILARTGIDFAFILDPAEFRDFLAAESTPPGAALAGLQQAIQNWLDAQRHKRRDQAKDTWARDNFQP